MFIQTTHHVALAPQVRVTAHKYRPALGDIGVRLGNNTEVNLTLAEATALRERLDAAVRAVATGTFPVGATVLHPDHGGTPLTVIGSFVNHDGDVMVTVTGGDALPATELSQLWPTA